jgi:hypothetical protein
VQSSSDDKHLWAELYWREIEYRHALYWKSLYLWGGGALITLLAPFIRPETKQLENAVFIFPIFGLIIAIVGAWHLAAEAERLALATGEFNRLRGEYLPTWPYRGKRNSYQQAVSEPIREAVTFLYLFGFSVLSGVSILFCLSPKPWGLEMAVWSSTWNSRRCWMVRIYHP